MSINIGGARATNLENRPGKSTTDASGAQGLKRTALAPATNVQNNRLPAGQSKPFNGPSKRMVLPVKPVGTQDDVRRLKNGKISRPLKSKDENSDSQGSDTKSGKSSSSSESHCKQVARVGSKIPKLNAISRMSTVIDFASFHETLGFSSHLLPPEVEDIDANDANNILLTPEYVNDIYSYLRWLEKKQTLKANFLAVQREMTPKMRAVLVDWLVNVHYQFRLLPETLYLGVSIMDRFFQTEAVSKDKIQLVGVTSFFIASKFEEIYPPDIKDFVVICDQLYHKRDIIKMEMVILRALKFELGRPLPLHFLRRNSKAAHADSKIHTMAKYLMELTLVEYECSHWAPSFLAATALYVTLKILGESSEWTPTLAFYSNYTEEQIIPNASLLCRVIRKVDKSKFQNCKKKYASSKLLAISKCPELSAPFIEKLAEAVPL